MTEEYTTPQIVSAPPLPPRQQQTTVEGFIYSLGSVVSNLRTRHRLSENAAVKVTQVALEYDMNRRAYSQPEIEQEGTVGLANERSTDSAE